VKNRKPPIPNALAARHAIAGFDAVATLSRHFAAVLSDEKTSMGEAEFRAYVAASAAIAHNKLALANLGIALVELLLAHYKKQVDAAYEAQCASSASAAISKAQKGEK
jgi:hypothetical protein